MNDDPAALKREDVLRRFARAAAHFDQADFVHRHTAAGLFERLAPMRIDAARVVDLGSATGRDRKLLTRRFRGSLIIGVDRSFAMLARARSKRNWLARSLDLQADAERLPFADGSIDLVYANLLLPWIDSLQVCFSEVARVLREGGLFVFSTLGPDSFREMREAWGDPGARYRVRAFPDMHDVGDGLVRSGLRDPVLDVDRLALEYRDVDKLFFDLSRTAARNSLKIRQQSLGSRAPLRRLRERLTNGGNSSSFGISLEIVYGHAWGSGARVNAGEYRVALNAIPRRRR